jgi:hypothetical protein
MVRQRSMSATDAKLLLEEGMPFFYFSLSFSHFSLSPSLPYLSLSLLFLSLLSLSLSLSISIYLISLFSFLSFVKCSWCTSQACSPSDTASRDTCRVKTVKAGNCSTGDEIAA